MNESVEMTMIPNKMQSISLNNAPSMKKNNFTPIHKPFVRKIFNYSIS
ncbi:MAG: hypothetical protein LBD60_03555 [Puniceicoccales bacterium]|nr:hypothetical protein [Puniceicoccales bacterium]